MKNEIKIGFFNYYKIYNNNRMFKDISSPIGDDLMYPFVYLSEFAKTKDISVSTIDTEPLENYDAIVFIEFPSLENKYFRQLIDNKFKNLYLLIFESEIIRPDNWSANNHKYFKKVFTWNDKLVDGKKYFKFYWPNKIPKNLDFDINKKNKLCTMIVCCKMASHPLELYTDRIKAIRWFEQNNLEDFDLYGIGWSRYRYCPSYNGSVKSKREVLQKYKFAICYENARDIPGYITEKIFDCFFAGCVPIYWGAPNITEHIPANTFIDRRKFNSYEELYNYLKMPDREYIKYLDAIKKFIESKKIYPFSAKCFAETITREIVNE